MCYLFLFLIGTCVGSFINVVVYRLNLTSQESRSLPRHLRGVIFGRSVCPRCKHKLTWYDNVPLFSFCLLKGKCCYCHSPISWQYPLVELATGVLTLLIFNFSPFCQGFAGQAIFNLLITYVLVAVFVSDLRYMVIPDKVLIFAALVSLIFLISLYPNILISHLLSAGGAAGFFGLLVLATRGRGMGLGDVKLAGLMGLILGWPKVGVALFLAFLTGALVGAILILLAKKKFGQHIPFGPFLAASTLLTLLWGSQILAIFQNWFWY